MKPGSIEQKPRRKTALRQLGGEIEVWPEASRETAALCSALDVPATETAQLADVHAFHSYPARMHPETAARLIAAWSRPSDLVLDPFCGSGTVLVEARRSGRRGLGYDVNPLSRELVWLKTLVPEREWRARLLDASERVAAHADERRARKAGATVRYSPAERELFAPHVLLELDGLRDGITREEDASLRRALSLVLSALLTKVSRKGGDTGEGTEQKSVAPGFAARFFKRKTHELAGQLERFAASLPARSPPAECVIGDARKPIGLRPQSVALVVSSPPYPGVYDYFQHHHTRLCWLGLASEPFERLEMGSRRALSDLPFARALALWENDLSQVLGALHRALTTSGRIALLIADSTLAGRAVHAERAVEAAGARAGLVLVARASQRRPHFHGASRGAFASRPRREHLLLLEPSASASARAGGERAAPLRERKRAEQKRPDRA